MEISEDILKSPLVILTGAGASAALGKMTTAKFLQLLFENVNRLEAKNKEAGAYLRRVLPAALIQPLDVEDILGTLEDRERFLDYLLADPEFLKDVLQGDTGPAARYRGRDIAVRDFIYDQVIEHYGAIDAAASADLYRGLLGHLRQWTDQVVGHEILTLPFFTLNYDPAVEAACSALSVRCVDGIQTVPGRTERRWVRSAFQTYREHPDSTTVVLVKLHGSVRLGRRPMARYGVGEDELVELPELIIRDPEPYEHAVLYPSRGTKTLTSEPFYTHYRLFSTCLQRAALLVVIGCSLRDSDVLTALRVAVEDNPKLRLLVVDPRAQHAVAAAIHIPPERVAVEPREFATEDPAAVERGLSPFMGLVRGYLGSALGGEQAGNAFAFGKTAAPVPQGGAAW